MLIQQKDVTLQLKETYHSSFFFKLKNQAHTFYYNYETRFLIWQFTWVNEKMYACDFKHNWFYVFIYV